MTRPPSILSRVITATAERLAQHPSILPENRGAFVQQASSVMHHQWSAMFGGENVWVRVYAPRNNTQEREARRDRILAALKAGEAAVAIAKRERVTADWVRKVAARQSCIESRAVPVDHALIADKR